MPFLSKKDIFRLGYLQWKNKEPIVDEIEEIIEDLGPADRFVARRQAKKQIKKFCLYLDHIDYCKKKKKRIRKEKKDKRKWFRANYHWGKTLHGQKRRTIEEIYTGYRINSPRYVKFVNKIATFMQGYIINKGWFYQYFNPSGFKINDPRAPYIPYDIAAFLRRFSFIDRDDWKQIVVIALWQVYGDLEHLPHPFYAIRSIRLHLKKWFWWAYRETFREMILEGLVTEDDFISPPTQEDNLFFVDLDRFLTPYQKYRITASVLMEEGWEEQGEMFYMSLDTIHLSQNDIWNKIRREFSDQNGSVALPTADT